MAGNVQGFTFCSPLNVLSRVTVTKPAGCLHYIHLTVVCYLSKIPNILKGTKIFFKLFHMKKLYNTYLSLIIAVTFISCSKEEKEIDDVAYYKFTAEDVNQIPEFTLNQKVVYKNQFGETLNFTVTSLSEDKVLYTVGMGFLSPYAASYFYYDRKQISQYC